MRFNLQFRSSAVLQFCSVLALTAAAFASSISGTITNGTTGKPAAGDDVILIKLSGTMQEEARTTSDGQGHYTLQVADDSVPHLIRVVHQKAQYHQPAPPGTSHVDVKVFDVAAKLDGVTGNVDLMRVQTDQSGLAVTELFALQNNSSPPRTQFSDKSFELYVPPRAAVDAGMAEGPGGMPVRSAPVPLPDKGHYAFIFPIRPGETRFQIAYHLPYSGSANFTPRLAYPVQSMAIMLPKTMQFTAAKAGSFESVMDQNGVAVQVARNIPAGVAPAFRVSGTGTIPDNALGDDQGNGADSGGASSSAGNRADGFGRPGGGLGTPEDSPDPLANYRWYIIAGIALVFAAAAFWMTSRSPQPAAASASAAAGKNPVAPPLSRNSATGPEPSSRVPQVPREAVPNVNLGTLQPTLLLQALKEELFQLETERLQNKISQQEYEQAKAALDQTLARAIKRSGT
jgi:hypothetical protein